ncbi:MAG: polysaccharide pyruvyl transferase family protein [Acetatifactor sp.]
MKYGLYYFKNTHNLGDDIWAYAQSKFYPHIDYLIDNTNAYSFRSTDGEKVAAILGAFIQPYNYEYSFLLSKNIFPLFVGSYFRPTMLELLEKKTMQKYLAGYAPIGCRTRALADFFLSKGIDAYFSGCITLTLPDLCCNKEEYICVVDVPDEVEKKVKEMVGSKYRIVVTSHDIDDVEKHARMSMDERFDIVERQIYLYSKAHCVITSRLHAALPCLTQHTPVLLVVTRQDRVGVNDIQARIQDFFPMLHHCWIDDFLSGDYDFDFVTPPENNSEYKFYRKKIEETCFGFVNQCEAGKLDCTEICSTDKINILEEKVVQLKTIIDNKKCIIDNLLKEKEEYTNKLLKLQARLREYENFNERKNV